MGKILKLGEVLVCSTRPQIGRCGMYPRNTNLSIDERRAMLAHAFRERSLDEIYGQPVADEVRRVSDKPFVQLDDQEDEDE